MPDRHATAAVLLAAIGAAHTACCTAPDRDADRDDASERAGIEPGTLDRARTGREVFPGVRVDADRRTVEFEGVVPIDAHHPDTPRVYLELVACSPDTREHESLVMTPARPSHLHAALLLVGLEPGRPGSWDWDGHAMTSVPPKGDPVQLEIVFVHPDSGELTTADPSDWIRDLETDAPFDPGHWVFAGSRIVEWQGREFYDADGTGTVIGLTTFGSETIAAKEVHSHESAVQTPAWIARPDRVPPYNTPVIVRIRPADES